MVATAPQLTLDATFLDALYPTTPVYRIVQGDDTLYEFAHHALPEACGFDLVEAYVAQQARGQDDLAIALLERYEDHLRTCKTFNDALEVLKLYAAAITLFAPVA